MIGLTKVEEPQVLADNAARWLQVIEDKLARGETPTEYDKSRYRHPDIKEALKQETHKKCAYCESYLLHVTFGDVEHISPKSLRLADTFRWSNLTLACDACNTFKRDAAGLVDPYVDDPEQCFRFLGPMIYADPTNARAVRTERQLRLNRVDLVYNRLRRLDAIRTLLLLIENTADGATREVLIADLRENETADNTEYAAFVRSMITAVEAAEA